MKNFLVVMLAAADWLINKIACSQVKYAKTSAGI